MSLELTPYGEDDCIALAIDEECPETVETIEIIRKCAKSAWQREMVDHILQKGYIYHSIGLLKGKSAKPSRAHYSASLVRLSDRIARQLDALTNYELVGRKVGPKGEWGYIILPI